MLEHKTKYIFYIKAIALAVAFIFTLNTLVWADPDLFQGGGSNVNLSPPSASATNIFFPDKTRIGSAVALIAEGIQAPLSEIDLSIPVILHEEGDKKVIGWLDFKSKREENGLWIVPCAILNGKVLNAVFTPDKKLVEMRDDSPLPHRLLEYKGKPVKPESPDMAKSQKEKIEAAKIEDTHAIAILSRHVYPQFSAEAAESRIRKSIEKGETDDGIKTYVRVCRIGNKVAGYICARDLSNPGGEKHLKITDQAVSVDFRERGIATRLFKDLLGFAKKEGYTHISTAPIHIAIEKIATSFGFVKDEQDEYHLWLHSPAAAEEKEKTGSEKRRNAGMLSKALALVRALIDRIRPKTYMKDLPKGYSLIPDYYGKTDHVLVSFSREYEAHPVKFLGALNSYPRNIKVTIAVCSEDENILRNILERNAPEGIKERINILVITEGRLSTWMRDPFLVAYPENSKKPPLILKSRIGTAVYRKTTPGDSFVADALCEQNKKGLFKKGEVPFFMEGGDILVDHAPEGKKRIFIGSATFNCNRISEISTAEASAEKLAESMGAELVALPSYSDKSHIDSWLTFIGNNRVLVGSLDLGREVFFERMGRMMRKCAASDELKALKEISAALHSLIVALDKKETETIHALAFSIVQLVKDHENEKGAGGFYLEWLKNAAAVLENYTPESFDTVNAAREIAEAKTRLESIGYEVTLVPWMGIRTDSVPAITYNNVLFLDPTTIIMPEYEGFEDLNARAREIYEKLGFWVIGTDITEPAIRNGAIRCATKRIGVSLDLPAQRKPKSESPDILWPRFQTPSEDDTPADNTSDVDAGKAFIVDHIKEGRAVEVYEKGDVAYRIRLDRSNPRDPPLEEQFKLDGIFRKIRDAKDFGLLGRILEEKKNFRNLTPGQKIRLMQIVRDASISLLLGQVIIGRREGDAIVTHVRTGYSKYLHGLKPTIWIGELLLRRITIKQLAHLMLEECQHILKPYKEVNGKWINLHGKISEAERRGQDPGEIVEHDEDLIDSLDTTPPRREELDRVRTPKLTKDSKPESPDMAKKKHPGGKTMLVTILGRNHRVKRDIWNNIVPATPDDAGAIFKLSKTIPSETTRQLSYENADHLRALIMQGSTFAGRPIVYLVYKEGGAVKGYIGVEITDTRAVKILQTAVDTSCRGKGIATVLSAKLIHESEKKLYRKFLRRPVHPATQKVAQRFGFTPVQGEGVPALVSNIGYWGLNVSMRDVFHEVMYERIAEDLTGFVTAIMEHNEDIVKKAIHHTITSMWLTVGRLGLRQEDYAKVYHRSIRFTPELDWAAGVLDRFGQDRAIEILALLFAKDLPWASKDGKTVGIDHSPQKDLIEAGIRYWAKGEEMRQEAFESLRQGNITPLIRYQYLKALNNEEEMGKVADGVSVEDTENGTLLAMGKERLFCTYKMRDAYLRKGKQPTMTKPKPESPDMARGENIEETQLANAFRKFAGICRKNMQQIRQNIEDGKLGSALHWARQTSKETRRTCSRFSNEDFIIVFGDSFQDIEALAFDLQTKTPGKEIMLVCLDNTEKVLVEFEKLMAAGRLRDAPKARISSGVLDASLVLDVPRDLEVPAKECIVNNGLLSESFAGYYAAHAAIINPDSEEKTVGYGGAGADISSLWLATRFTTAYFFDRIPVDIERLKRYHAEWKPTDKTDKYFAFKHSNGFSLGETFRHEPYKEFYLIQELIAMGIRKEDVEILEGDGINRARHEIVFRFPGDTVKRRIIFVKHKLRDVDEILNSKFNGSLDVYFEKGAASFVPHSYTKKWIKPGGYLVLEDLNLKEPLDTTSANKIARLIGDNLTSVAPNDQITESMRRIIERFNPQSGHGWKLMVMKRADVVPPTGRDLAKLENAARAMALKDLLGSDIYTARDVVDVKSILESHSIDKSRTFLDILRDKNIRPYVKWKLHEILIDGFIRSFYEGVGSGKWHYYGEINGEYETLADVKKFFDNVLGYNRPMEILISLLEKRLLNVLEVEGKRPVFDAHASTRYGINVCDSCDMGAALVHELMALSGSADDEFNEEVENAYKKWRDTGCKDVSGISDIKNRIASIKTAPQGLGAISLPDLTVLDARKNPDYEPDKFKDINEMTGTVEPQIAAFMDKIKRIEEGVYTGEEVRELSRLIPSLVAACGSDIEHFRQKAEEYLAFIVRELRGIYLDDVLVEFYKQGVAISPFLRSVFEKAYMDEEVAHGLYPEPDSISEEERVTHKIFMYASILSRRVSNFEEWGYTHLVAQAYKQAYEVYRLYIKRIATRMREELDAGRPCFLNIFNFDNHLMSDDIRSMVSRIVKDRPLSEALDIKPDKVDYSYAMVCERFKRLIQEEESVRDIVMNFRDGGKLVVHAMGENSGMSELEFGWLADKYVLRKRLGHFQTRFGIAKSNLIKAEKVFIETVLLSPGDERDWASVSGPVARAKGAGTNNPNAGFISVWMMAVLAGVTGLGVGLFGLFRSGFLSSWAIHAPPAWIASIFSFPVISAIMLALIVAYFAGGSHPRIKPQESTKIIVEIDARALCRTYGTISNVPKESWDWIASLGVGVIWLKGAWAESRQSGKLMHGWRRLHREDILERQPSAYDVYKYRINSKVARNKKEFKEVVDYLKKRGITVILDFVTNHIAVDSPLIKRFPWLVISRKDPGFPGDSYSSPYPKKSELIVQHARFGPFERSGPNLANFNLLEEKARAYMRRIIGKIADLTLNGGIRADLAFLAFRLHVYTTWAIPLGISLEDFDKRMPREFWEEAMEEIRSKYPGMLIIAESYEHGREKEEQPWFGRFGEFHRLGIAPYDKHFYDLLRSGNIDPLRWMLFTGMPPAHLKRSVHFIENHDEQPAIEAFGSGERAMAAAVMSYAAPGYPLIPLRQIFAMGTPEGVKTGRNMEIKSPDGGIYTYSYPDILANSSVVNSPLAKLMWFISRPVFRRGEFYETFAELQHSGLVSFVRHLGDEDALCVVNYSAANGVWANINLDTIYERYKNRPEAPRKIAGELRDYLTSQGVEVSMGEKKISVKFPAWGYCLFHFAANELEVSASPVDRRLSPEDLPHYADRPVEWWIDYIFKEGSGAGQENLIRKILDEYDQKHGTNKKEKFEQLLLEHLLPISTAEQLREAIGSGLIPAHQIVEIKRLLLLGKGITTPYEFEQCLLASKPFDKAQGRPETPPPGTAKTLLMEMLGYDFKHKRYRRRDVIGRENAKSIKELAKESRRGGNDSIRTFYREVDVLCRAWLIEGFHELETDTVKYYVPDWLLKLDPKEVMRKIPELDVANPKASKIRSIRAQVKELKGFRKPEKDKEKTLRQRWIEKINELKARAQAAKCKAKDVLLLDLVRVSGGKLTPKRFRYLFHHYKISRKEMGIVPEGTGVEGDKVETHKGRLNPAGQLTVDGRVVASFKKYPNAPVTYKTRTGEADRSTVVLLDRKGKPLKRKGLRYAVDLETGEVRCHLPENILTEFIELLDNVRVEGDVLTEGKGELNVAGHVAYFTNYPGASVTYEIHKGKVGRITVFFGDEEIHKERLNLLGRLIVDGKTEFISGKCPNANVTYKVRDGKVDRSTITLLDKNGNPLKRKGLRYAVDLDTGKVLCHLPDVIPPDFPKLDNVRIKGSVLNAAGMLKAKAFGGYIAVFDGYAGASVIYEVHDGKADRATVLLVNERGRPLKKKGIRRAVDLKTGKIKCHLPTKVMSSYLGLFDNVRIEGSKTDDNGYLHIGGKTVAVFTNFPDHAVTFEIHKGQPDGTTVLLVDKKGEPAEDERLRLAVDLTTGKPRCHFMRYDRGLFKSLDNVKIAGDRLGLTGGHFAPWKKTFKKYRNARIEYEMHKGIVPKISVLDEDSGRVIKEITKPLSPAELAARDIMDYYDGKKVKPVEGRISKLYVTFEEGKRFRAETKKDPGTGKKLMFTLSPIASLIYRSKNTPREAEARIEGDPDYGSYIEISREGAVLSGYYYFPKLKRCAQANFSKMAIVDYARDAKNVYGEPMYPREYWHGNKVPKNGIIKLGYGNHTLILRGLKALAGREIALIPFEDEEYGTLIGAHDAVKYRKNRNRKPDVKFFRDVSEGGLVKLGGGTSEAEKKIWKPKWTRMEFIAIVNQLKSTIAKDDSGKLVTPEQIAAAAKGNFNLTEAGFDLYRQHYHISYKELKMNPRSRRKLKARSERIAAIKDSLNIDLDFFENLFKGVTGLSGEKRISLGTLQDYFRITRDVAGELNSLLDRMTAKGLRLPAEVSDILKKISSDLPKSRRVIYRLCMRLSRKNWECAMSLARALGEVGRLCEEIRKSPSRKKEKDSPEPEKNRSKPAAAETGSEVADRSEKLALSRFPLKWARAEELMILTALMQYKDLSVAAKALDVGERALEGMLEKHDIPAEEIIRGRFVPKTICDKVMTLQDLRVQIAWRAFSKEVDLAHAVKVTGIPETFFKVYILPKRGNRVTDPKGPALTASIPLDIPPTAGAEEDEWDGKDSDGKGPGTTVRDFGALIVATIWASFISPWLGIVVGMLACYVLVSTLADMSGFHKKGEEFEPTPASGAEEKDVAFDKLAEKELLWEFAEYDGTVYYPFALDDLESVFELAGMFPKAGILLNDAFIQKETALSESMPDRNNMEEVSAFLKQQFMRKYPDKVLRVDFRIVDEAQKLLEVTVQATPETAKSIGKESITFRYQAGFFENLDPRPGVIFVKRPGYGGRFSTHPVFWKMLYKKLTGPGFVLMDGAPGKTHLRRNLKEIYSSMFMPRGSKGKFDIYQKITAAGAEETDLWNDKRIVEIAKDLEESGLRNFHKVDAERAPPRIRNIIVSGGAELYEHKNGLRIVRKKMFGWNPGVIKELCMAKQPSWCPTFSVEGDRSHYFEIDLTSFGYLTLNEAVGGKAENLTDDTRDAVRRAVSEGVRQDNNLFIHKHLHAGNILVKLDDAGNVLDVRLIDLKLLLRARISDYKGLMALLDGKKSWKGSDLTAMMLEGFDFRGFDLSDAVLRYSNLAWADLRGVNMANANLTPSNLTGADLRGAILEGANLIGVIFEWADLRGARLEGADLSEAKLVNARFNMEDMRHAKLRQTMFNADKGPEFEVLGYGVDYDNREGICYVTSPAAGIKTPKPESPDMARKKKPAAPLQMGGTDDTLFVTKQAGAEEKRIRSIMHQTRADVEELGMGLKACMEHAVVLREKLRAQGIDGQVYVRDARSADGDERIHFYVRTEARILDAYPIGIMAPDFKTVELLIKDDVVILAFSELDKCPFYGEGVPVEGTQWEDGVELFASNVRRKYAGKLEEASPEDYYRIPAGEKPESPDMVKKETISSDVHKMTKISDHRKMGAVEDMYLGHDYNVFRDLVDKEELPTCFLEMLIGLNSNNKVVLAFDEKLAEGREGKPFMNFLKALENLKKNKKYERILRNLVIIPASVETLPSRLDEHKGKSNTKIFTFARKAKEAEDALSALEQENNTQVVYIDENGMLPNAYYPLAEIVTVTLAQVFAPEIISSQDIHSIVQGKLKVALAELNIDSVRREGKAIIFTLLPDAEALEYQQLIQRYAELKRFLKSA